jgi:hypothetical protein
VGYLVKRNLFGKDYWVGFPMSEHIICRDGREFSCNRWPNRLSDCQINGVPVNEIVYRRMQRAYRAERPQTKRPKRI